MSSEESGTGGEGGEGGRGGSRGGVDPSAMGANFDTSLETETTGTSIGPEGIDDVGVWGPPVGYTPPPLDWDPHSGRERAGIPSAPQPQGFDIPSMGAFSLDPVDHMTPGIASARAGASMGNISLGGPTSFDLPGGSSDPDADTDDSPDDHVLIAYNPQSQPTILNPVPEAVEPVTRPQYQYRRNWWEGNTFFPAPITRV